jgi:AraC family transcriptional regulator
MKPDTRSFYERAVVRAAEYVVRRLDDALDLDELAAEAGLSPFHFHRVFRGMLGETPLELHRRLRLERAAWSLRDGSAPVTRVAFEAGYDTHEAFTRAFRARYGHAPSVFRRLSSERREECIRQMQFELAARSGLHYSPVRTDDLILPTLFEELYMNADIIDRPAIRVVTCRHTGTYNRVSEAFARLHALAAPAGLLVPGAAMLAIYHDDPETTPESELRSDAALSISPTAAVPEGLGTTTIPAGRYARATHVGPYEGLGDAWAKLMGEWLPRSGFLVGDGVSYELYVNNPTNAPKESLRTELYLPLKAVEGART